MSKVDSKLRSDSRRSNKLGCIGLEARFFFSIKIYLVSDIKLLCIVKFIAFPVPIISLKDTISLLNRPWMLPSSIVCVKTKEIYWTGMCWRANILRWLYIHSEINHWAFNLGIFIWNKTIRDEKGVEVPENFILKSLESCFMICARYFEPHSNFEQIKTMTTTGAALSNDYNGWRCRTTTLDDGEEWGL